MLRGKRTNFAEKKFWLHVRRRRRDGAHGDRRRMICRSLCGAKAGEAGGRAKAQTIVKVRKGKCVGVRAFSNQIAIVS